MADYPPITLQMVDQNGNNLIPDVSVPFSFEIDVIQVMERAFVISQAADDHDPFLYTVEYYEYSLVPEFQGYLGYEIECIGNSTSVLPNNGQFYWELLLDNTASSTGADTTFPAP